MQGEQQTRTAPGPGVCQVLAVENGASGAQNCRPACGGDPRCTAGLREEHISAFSTYGINQGRGLPAAGNGSWVVLVLSGVATSSTGYLEPGDQHAHETASRNVRL